MSDIAPITDNGRPMPRLKSYAWQTDVDERDLPEDRFANHVNNARYFYFINLTFRAWYKAMGLREPSSPYTAIMVRTEYDFIAEVTPPSRLKCNIEVVRVGRSSLDHAVEIFDLGPDGLSARRLVGRGRIVHVCAKRATKQTVPWPADLLALCWPGEA